MRQKQLLCGLSLSIGLASAACERTETSTQALTPQSGTAAPAPAPDTLPVCERPESALFDAASKAWYVSCMAKPDVAGDGYIAKLNAAGDAIATEKFVQDERDEGSKILVEKPGGRVREVEFR